MKAQRLRVQFTRGDEMKYITHLDMMRFWERALRRAEIPLAYSEGFSPHPQISLAAPLPVGVTSDCELMDVFLEERMRPGDFATRVGRELPPAVRVVSVREVAVALPSMQAEMRSAEYEVAAPVPEGADVHAAVRAFMAADAVPWEHKREEEVKSYDLRALVRELEVVGEGEGLVRLRMLLRMDSGGSGRPEQVAAALGLGPPARLHRTRLVLAARSPSHEAWRRQGRFAV